MINNRTDVRKIDINNLFKSHFLACITRTALGFPLHILDTVQLHLTSFELLLWHDKHDTTRDTV